MSVQDETNRACRGGGGSERGRLVRMSLVMPATRGRAVRAPTLPKVGVGMPPEIKLILKANCNQF